MINLLLVEDEDQTRESIRQYLSRALDCQIQEASSGEDALDKMKQNEFDLIILDIRLPGLSGLDVLKQTRDKKLKFLVISGYDSIQVAEEALNEGAADYITKPFSMQILGQKIKQILSLTSG